MADLTVERRKKLRPSQFALPGKGQGAQGKGAGSYPIPDASHARNALARVAQHGSSEEKAKVRSAVGKKFPGIGQSSKPSSKKTGNGNGKGANGRLADKLGKRLEARDRS